MEWSDGHFPEISLVAAWKMGRGSETGAGGFHCGQVRWGGGWTGAVPEGMERRGGTRGAFGESPGPDERLVWEVMKGPLPFLAE